MTRALGLALLLAAVLGETAEPTRLEFGRFGEVRLYRDSATPAQVVLLFSGEAGWDDSMVAIARALAARDALVLGIDGERYGGALASSSDPCSYPAGELEALSQFAQKKLARPSYSVPYLVGIASGATLAHGALAQAPPNTFRAGLGIDFRTGLALARPFCRGHDLSEPDLPWSAIAGGDGAPDRAARSLGDLVTRHTPPRRELAADVSDLPLIELAPTGAPADAVAVVLSGDGGWASLDREVGGALAARGIPVIGLDSLQYFWTRRTPDESAAALARILRHADSRWPGRRLVLVGYSRGADVLPFMASRLPPELRARVALVVLLGPALTTEFEFHLSDWLGSGARVDALPIASEVEKLRGLRVLCVYGHDERESLCRELRPELAIVVEKPGDHHFDGDYEALAARIAQELAR